MRRSKRKTWAELTSGEGRVMVGQLCAQLAISGYGHRIVGLRLVGALLTPRRHEHETREGWVVVEAPSRCDRDALDALRGRHVRARTRLTNAMLQITWVTHVCCRDDSYAGTSRLCLRGRGMPALVTVAERQNNA
jgi:hypothetical protein